MKKSKIVTISEANQNFSKVARLCKDNGEIYIFKNNKPCFILKEVNSEGDDSILTDSQKIERLYDECKETITPSFDMNFHSSLLNNKEIRRFFICIADFFLQSRQREVIENERY